VIRPHVAMRAERHQHIAVGERETGPLVLGQRAETGVGDLNRASRFVGPGADVESVQHERECSGIIQGVHHVHRSRRRIDGGRAHDSGVAVDVDASRTVVRVGDRGSQVHVPVLRAGIRVERVDTVIGGGNIHHVVRSTGNADVRYHQRLGVDLVVERTLEQQTKLVDIHVRRRQNRFAQILPSATKIVVLRDDADLGSSVDGGYVRQEKEDKHKSDRASRLPVHELTPPGYRSMRSHSPWVSEIKQSARLGEKLPHREFTVRNSRPAVSVLPRPPDSTNVDPGD
jgi:hypothetical protein